MKFIHCLLPQHNAGCTDNKSLLSVKSNQSEDSVINVPLLRSQVKHIIITEKDVFLKSHKNYILQMIDKII